MDPEQHAVYRLCNLYFMLQIFKSIDYMIGFADYRIIQSGFYMEVVMA